MTPVTGWPFDSRRIVTFLPLSFGMNSVDVLALAVGFLLQSSSPPELLLAFSPSPPDAMRQLLDLTAHNYLGKGDCRL